MYCAVGKILVEGKAGLRQLAVIVYAAQCSIQLSTDAQYDSVNRGIPEAYDMPKQIDGCVIEANNLAWRLRCCDAWAIGLPAALRPFLHS